VTRHPDAYVLVVPAPCDWLRSNDRRHYHAAAALTKKWREKTAWLARQARIPHIDQPVRITCVIHRADRRKADAPNSWPSCKAAIDGLVDAGVLTDDSDAHVLSTTFQPGEIVRGSQLTLIIRPEKDAP
jgi:Holliday junction resolvase RusA-like endonuclease